MVKKIMKFEGISKLSLHQKAMAVFYLCHRKSSGLNLEYSRVHLLSYTLMYVSIRGEMVRAWFLFMSLKQPGNMEMAYCLIQKGKYKSG